MTLLLLLCWCVAFGDINLKYDIDEPELIEWNDYYACDIDYHTEDCPYEECDFVSVEILSEEDYERMCNEEDEDLD